MLAFGQIKITSCNILPYKFLEITRYKIQCVGIIVQLAYPTDKLFGQDIIIVLSKS